MHSRKPNRLKTYIHYELYFTLSKLQTNWANFSTMISKEQVKKEIDGLSDAELEKVYQYLTSLKKAKKSTPEIRSLKLNGKLDSRDIRSLVYE